MTTHTVPPKEIDALRQRVTELENQLARREQTALALQEDEERLHSVLNNLLDAPYRRNLRTDCYDYLSPAIEQLTGWTIEEMNRAAIEMVLSWVHPDDLPQVQQEIERIDALCREVGRATGRLEYRFRTKAGDYLWLGDYLTVVAGADRQPLYRVGVVRDISERKRMEEAVTRSEMRYRQTLDKMLEGCQIIDFNWRYTYINEAAVRQGRLHHTQLLGRTMMEMYPGIEDTELFAVLRDCMENRVSHKIENRFTFADETSGYFELNIQPVSEGLFILSIDITERKQAEAALNESEAKYRLLVETANEGIWMMDNEHRTTYVNQAMAEMLGYTPMEILGKKVEDFFFAEDMAFHRERMRKRHAGQDEVYERRFKRRDGSALWTLVSARVIKDNQGEFNGSFAMFTDITERKHAEEALRKSEALLAEAQRIGHIGHWEWTAPGRELVCSDELRRILELPQSGPVLHETIKAMVSPAEQERLFQLDQKAFANRGNLDYEFCINRADGQLGWLYQQTGVTYAENGQPVRMIGVIQDITERKRVEEKLRESEERFRLFMDNSPTTAWIKDEKGRHVYLSRTYENRFGVRLANWLGKTDFELWPPEVAKKFWQNDQKVLAAGRLLEFTEETVTPDGNRRTWWNFKFPFQDASGQRYVAGIGLDITERKQAEDERAKLEEQLHQAQKMESIGRLAGGVAHDFNNLLTVILGYSELMQARLPLSDLALERLEQIRQAAKRAEGLTRQLLAFSRKQMLISEVFDLNELVTNLRKMLERLIPEDITLITVLQPDLWWIKADPGQIEQVLMNLVVNARDAMPTGGRLTIETANISLDDPFIQAHPEILGGPGVRLTITDTGCGIDEATQTHIFEPFFTTKEQGKGTGLGLAMVYGIIKQSGGEITIASQPEKGAAFTFYLPAHETVLPDSTVLQPEAVAQLGRETILLVEDESVVRDFVQVALHHYGYTLLEADHGYQALALAQQEQSIDLLLTDVVMPDINGRELAERTKALHPRLKVLFMSGYTDDEVLRHGVQRAEVEFIAKPFSPVALAAKVREILDR